MRWSAAPHALHMRCDAQEAAAASTTPLPIPRARQAFVPRGSADGSTDGAAIVGGHLYPFAVPLASTSLPTP